MPRRSRFRLDGKVIGIVAACLAILAVVAVTLASGDELGIVWLATFAVGGALVAIVLILVRSYIRRNQRRVRTLRSTHPDAVVFSSYVSVRFRREARAIASATDAAVRLPWLVSSVAVLVDRERVAILAGRARLPWTVIAVPAGLLDGIGRSSSFGLDGTPVPGIQFEFVVGERRLPLNVYLIPVDVRPAIDRIRRVLG